MNTTIEIPRTPAIERNTECEDVIELTISEVDRQTAGPFQDSRGCLLCTALRNRGYNTNGVDPNTAYLESWDDQWRFDEYMGMRNLRANLDETNKPFYGPGVVGKVVRLRKVKSNSVHLA